MAEVLVCGRMFCCRPLASLISSAMSLPSEPLSVNAFLVLFALAPFATGLRRRSGKPKSGGRDEGIDHTLVRMQECGRRALDAAPQDLLRIVCCRSNSYQGHPALRGRRPIARRSSTSWQSLDKKPSIELEFEIGGGPLKSRCSASRLRLEAALFGRPASGSGELEAAHVPCKPQPHRAFPYLEQPCNAATLLHVTCKTWKYKRPFPGGNSHIKVPCCSSPPSCLLDDLRVRVSDLLVVAGQFPAV